MEEETEIIKEGIERARDLHQGWLEERFSQIEAEENEIREGIERAKDLQQIWLEEYDAKTLETIQSELLMKADFYSQISGYEDKYREAQFEWIDLEAKRLKQAGMEEVAIAKWTAQEKKKISSDIYLKENQDRQEAFSSMAQNFAQMALLYKEDSTARTTLSTLSKAATIAEIALQAQKNLMIAVGAVVQQGTGDPYTAFARIAAMIAVVSSVLQIVGIAFSSSGGSSRSYSPGGTAIVGGIAGEASESARKSLELLEDTYTMEYRALTNIYDEMKSLNRNITGLVSSIVRGGGIGGAESYGIEVGLTQNWAQKVGEKWMTSTKLATIGFVFGGLIGAVIGWVVGWLWKGIFGGGKEITVGGTGIELGKASVGGLLGGEGMTAQQYADIKVKKDGGWFGGGTSRSYYTLYQALDEDVTRLLTKVFRDLGATLVELSISLGTDTQAALDYVFPGGKINLAGLDTEGIDKAISQFISGAADDAVEALFGQMLRSYQKVGEGLLETAVRLVIDKEIILNTLRMTGQAFVGTTTEIISFSEALIEMAGDLKTLREAAETYYDKFFNDVEKQVRLQGQLTDMMIGMNMVLPGTREGYRHLVEGLDLTTEAGRGAYVSLLILAEGADVYYKSLEEAQQSLLEAQQSLLEAQQSLISYWVSITQENLSEAQAALRSAFEAEKYSITETAQIIISDLKSGLDKLRSARDRMRIEDESFGRNQYYAAKATLAAILQQARMGDLSGVKDIDKTLDVLTGSSIGLFSSFADYQRDYWKTYQSISELERLTEHQLTVEEKFYKDQIAALDSQMNALLNINTSVLSIAEAISRLAIAMGAVTAATGAVTTGAMYYGQYLGEGGFASDEAYAAEIKRKLKGNIPFQDPFASEQFMRDHPELFAQGGSFQGGWRVVGEQGPELEYTGPSTVLSNPKSKALVDNVILISEIRKLREEVHQGNFQIAKNTGKLVRINDRWDSDGLPAERTI
jgi:hypothetical protein